MPQAPSDPIPSINGRFLDAKLHGDAKLRGILERLRQHGPSSRADLARQTGLSAPTVSTAVAALRRRGLVTELGPGRSRGGRPPGLVRFNAEHGYVAGVDIGGSQVRVALADLSGVVAGQWARSTRGARSPEAVVAAVRAGVRELQHRHAAARGKLLTLVSGAPGTVADVRAGVVRAAPHLARWRDVPLGPMLNEALRVPVWIENDVNLGALGERWRGVAQGVPNFVFLAIGTGVGAGIVLGGRLYRGAAGAAGEVGYVQVPETAIAPLARERSGPLEAAIGGAGIVRAWRGAVRARSGRHPRRALRPTEIFDRARSGDAVCRSVLERTARLLARAVADLAVILNPSLIVLGGGIGTHPALVEATRRVLEPNDMVAVRLVPSLLGVDAQLQGAIRLALARARHGLLPASRVLTAPPITSHG